MTRPALSSSRRIRSALFEPTICSGKMDTMNLGGRADGAPLCALLLRQRRRHCRCVRFRGSSRAERRRRRPGATTTTTREICARFSGCQSSARLSGRQPPLGLDHFHHDHHRHHHHHHRQPKISRLYVGRERAARAPLHPSDKLHKQPLQFNLCMWARDASQISLDSLRL